MSWSTNLASFAKTALKEAQKTIDKALEINEAESDGSLSSSTTSEKVAAVTEAATDFFASWGVGGTKKQKEASDESCEQEKVPEESFKKQKPVDKKTSEAQHKRSSSLESSQVVSQSKRESLTNDIPVTLLPLPPLKTLATTESDKDSEEAKTSPTFPTHQRSFSDTIFNLGNDSHEFVQVLDEPEIQTHQTITIIANQPVTTPLELSPDKDLLGNTVTKEEYEAVDHIALSNNNETCLSKDEKILDTLTTVDLNAPSVEDSWNHVPNTNQAGLSIDALVTSDNNTVFDSNSWSWADELSSISFVKSDTLPAELEKANLESETLQIVSSPESLDEPKVSSAKEEENKTSNSESILDSFMIQPQYSSEDSSQLESSSGTVVLEQSHNKTEEIDNNLSCEHDDKMFKASSPPASSNSVPDSPRSSSPLPVLHHFEDSRQGSPENNFEIMTHDASSKMDCHSIPGEAFLPESSRSSSIVVVSARASSGGSGSAASTGSGPDMHRDIDLDSNSHPHCQDHLHLGHGSDGSSGSSGYERVELPSSSHSSDPTSPEFVKCKHRKGPSSASSSDIEVILSTEFSRHNQVPSSQTSELKIMPALSSVHQQTSLDCEDAETQTDVTDEGKALAEEIPKKVTHEISEIMAEKDQMIEQLTEEGEKLSKKQFELSQTIKKLRAKEKELENSVKNLKGELAGKNLENDRLTKSFVNKESVEKNLNDIVQKLTTEKRTLELKIEQIQSELEDAKENCATMKASVEDASVEILELKNAISSAQRDSTELDILTREKSDLISRNESLQKELDNLRSTMNSNQEKSASRETELHNQVATLTRKVHHLENQLADVSSEVADATMPLSLQIEKLQGELKQSQMSFEKRESSLNSHLLDLEMRCKNALEKENSLKEQNTVLQTTLSTFEAKINELEMENRNLKRDISFREENEQKKIQDKMLKITKMEFQIQKLTSEVERLNQENEQLGLELKSEKTSLEQERKRNQGLLEQLSLSGRNLNQQQQLTKSNSIANPSSNANYSPKSGENSPGSNSVVSEASYLDEVLDPHGQLNHRSMTPRSFFDSYSTTGLMEHVQSQLRQREIEVVQFQDEIIKNEKIRKSLNDEIAKLTMRNHEFQQEAERLTELKPKLEELEKNYNALLQMYGEKVEETDELRMDLQDVKEMYKTQIEQLLKR